MAAPVIASYTQVIPSQADFEKLLTAKLSYEAKQNTKEKDAWNKAHFNLTPWGIAWGVSIAQYKKATASYNNNTKRKSNNPPKPKADLAFKYLIVAIAIDWQELVAQLKTALRNWGYTTKDLQDIAKNVWLEAGNLSRITSECDRATVTGLIEQLKDDAPLEELTEAIEKHNSLNSKLFTKDEILKDTVRDKMLEIVDTFLADLKEQDIKIKVDDILVIGSNASYNYTKDSDIDLHILANTKSVDYPADLGAAIYSAYRSIFNKSLDITIYGIPLEIFVETEDSTKVSNGIYSVKKNKWIKKPVQEDIPEYDKEALDKLVDEWEDKCKKLIVDIKADKLDDEKKIVKMLEDIYEKLRKKGVAKGEYAIENLAFKELRNKGYLDQLKDYRNELTSKRLSLEEKFDRQARVDLYNQLVRAAGTQPVIQDNGLFFIYNLKASEVDKALSAIRRLPFVVEAHANENGKYDFSNTIELAMNKMPKKYYNISGKLNF